MEFLNTLCFWMWLITVGLLYGLLCFIYKRIEWRIQWKIKLEFKLEDFWIGVSWKKIPWWDSLEFTDDLHIWICIIPCLPIHMIKNASDREYEN